MTTSLDEVRIPAPELRGGNLDLGACRDLEVLLDGPAGCIAGETRIYNPVTGEHVPVKELYEQQKAPTVQTLIGAVQSEVPFRKGVADLYRLTLASGRKCIVTQNHLLLSDNSWIYLSACVPGTRLLISSPCLHLTTEVLGPLVSLQDALRLSQTPLGSQERYSAYSHPYGVRPRLEEGNVLTVAPSLGDAHEHNHDGFYKDDRETLSGYSHHSQPSDHHARTCYSPLSDGTACTLFHAQSETSLLIDALCQYDERFQKAIYPLSPTAQSLLDGGSTSLHERWSVGYYALLADAALSRKKHQLPRSSMQCSSSLHMTQELPVSALSLDACNLSMDTSNSISKYHYTAQWDTVSSIEYVRTDEYFDLHVPIAEHYLAEGIWHHNSGKTLAALFKIHLLLLMYPGAKALVARKTNTALAGTAMATYRTSILDEREGVKYFGGNKIKPAAFEYPNGSMLIVSGLDKPEKVKSLEVDLCFINEATECTVDDLEFVRSRLRNGKTPYPQVIMDCNPDAPTHWLNTRCNEGLTTRILSRHEHNPRFYNAVAQEWTQEGRHYIEEVLGGLTGVRLARLRYGVWAAAEGTIYEDSWNRAINVIDRFPIPLEWPRYLAIDFGYTNPFVCLWAALDPDGRIIIYRQIYMTRRLVEDHARDIKRYSRWAQDGGDPLPREIICDHDAEGRATLERHLGLMTVPAHKNVLEGIQAVAARFKPAGDGKPRILIMRDSLVERDQELANMKRPCCLEDEPEVYVWRMGPGVNAKEEPLKEFDHGLDALRYLAARWDLRPMDVRYSSRIY